MIKLKGYIFSRPFFGERAPQHIQNIVLNDYCKKNNYQLFLSDVEYHSEKSSYILFNLLKKLSRFDGLIFYSLFQLPINTKKRYQVYKKIIYQKKQIHFVVENIIADNKEKIEEIEKIFLLKLITSKKNKFQIINNYFTPYHMKTKRDYLERINNNKIKCMKIAKKYDKNFWDGERKYGYGGYKYIPNYFRDLALKLINDFKLTNESSILDVGCGKGFLLFEIKKILKKIKIYGCDISSYAKKHSIKSIKKNIFIHDIRKKLQFKNSYFDLVICINTLHNLKIPEIYNSIMEIERVGKDKYICVESFRNEKEQFNVQCWALTAETIIDKSSWTWLLEKTQYSGKVEFIYF